MDRSPPEDIWVYLYEVSNETNWRGSVIAAGLVSETPYRVGMTGLHDAEVVGDWPWTVTDWEENRSMSWNVTGSRLEGAHAGYRLAPEADSSRMTMHMRANPGLIMKILMSILKRRIRPMFAANLEKLKAILECKFANQQPSMPWP